MGEKKIITRADLISQTNFIHDIPTSFRDDMQVPVRVFIDEKMLEDVLEDRSLLQLVNVSTLPGIKGYSFGMPDIHQGYGFPIGGVAATAIDQGGVISPGGIGYDINCGVRLLSVDLSEKELKDQLPKLATSMFRAVPSGVGRGGKLDFEPHDLDAVLSHGASHMVSLGYGVDRDLEYCEDGGCLSYAKRENVSDRAKKRGHDQLGTLGSGNHFLEIQIVDEILDEAVAQAYGLKKDGVAVMIHCGSRGLGHQTCTDYVKVMAEHASEWNYKLPDRELMCAPFNSQPGQDYFGAMAAAANFAWANRHTIGHLVRTEFRKFFSKDLKVNTVYDVCHNIGKVETHLIDGIETNLMVHRKGATRAFGPEIPGVPHAYQSVGQPVLIPGTMGTYSYVLAGTSDSMNVAFGSCCHGAGRRMSRSQAKKYSLKKTTAEVYKNEQQKEISASQKESLLIIKDEELRSAIHTFFKKCNYVVRKQNEANKISHRHRNSIKP